MGSFGGILVGCQNDENMGIKLMWFVEFITMVVMLFTIVAIYKKFISEFFPFRSNKRVFWDFLEQI